MGIYWDLLDKCTRFLQVTYPLGECDIFVCSGEHFTFTFVGLKLDPFWKFHKIKFP